MSATPAPTEAVDPREVRRWFAARGFTSLLDGTAIARRPSGERFVQILALLLVMFALISLPLSEPQEVVPNLLSTTQVIGLMAAFWVVRNLVRGRAPFAPLTYVGWPERVAYVIIPTVASLLVPGPTQVTGFSDLENRLFAGSASLVGQLIMLGLVTLVINSSLWSLLAWLRRQVASSFLVAGGALGRTLPLLLGVVGFFFFTSELWQSVGRLEGWGYLLALGMFVLLSWVFLSHRGHLDLESLAHFDEVDQLRAELADTPLARVESLPAPTSCHLTAEQEGNLRLVAVISRMTVATVIAAAIFAFFVAFGVLIANAEAVRAWASAPPKVLLAWETGNHAFAVTAEHLRVAGFLGVFSGFYFAIVSATDASLRAGLRDTAEDAIREACAARVAALAAFPQKDGDEAALTVRP